MLSNYRRDRSLLGSGGVSGSYNHPAGVAKAIKVEVKKKISPLAGIVLSSQPTCDTNEAKWRVVTSTITLIVVTLSVLLFLTYRTYNAVIGGEGNGNWTTLPSIRTGNYLSLLALVA